jgi:ComF family protein
MFIDWIFEIIYPTRCVSCGKDRSLLCESCAGEIEPSGGYFCVVCGKATLGGFTHKTCTTRYTPERTLSGFAYKGPARELVKVLKYRRVRKAADVLAALLVKDLQDRGVSFGPKSLVVPIPLSFWRKNTRGFNQASLLAKAVADTLKLEFREDALKRVKDTPSQVSLNRKARARNIQGSFSAGEDLDGKDILLVDDVLTTGATVREAAKALKKTGAGLVWVLSFARD